MNKNYDDGFKKQIEKQKRQMLRDNMLLYGIPVVIGVILIMMSFVV